MPPKVKITKQEIVDAAVRIVQEKGTEALNARNIALALGCSTQPIFSNFSTMEQLHYTVIQKAEEIYLQYVQKELEEGKYPVYKASGMGYIRFAKEQRKLFHLLYMRDRTNENYPNEPELPDDILNTFRKMGLDDEKATMFHLEMWAFVHGIAVMLATSFVDLDFDLASRMITDVYQGLRKQYGLE